MAEITKRSTLNLFDWFLIIGIIATTLICNWLKNEIDIMGSIAGITGVVCVVLVAKRSIWNYIFGIVNVLLYGYISFKSKVYGDAVLNILYYFPMNIIGWLLWNRRKSSQQCEASTLVQCRFLSIQGRLITAAVSIVATLLVGYVLSEFTADPQPYKDSFTTIFSIVAMFLMVKAYMEQWILWILTDIVSVIMWGWLWYNGTPHAAVVFLMWVFYLANAINGAVVWSRSARGVKN